MPIATASPESDSDNSSTEVTKEEESDQEETKNPDEDTGGTAPLDEIPTTTEKPVASELPKCDGSFQDCVTDDGNVCEAGQGGHECECAEDMSDCPNHPTLEETSAQQVIEPCLLDPSLPECAPVDGKCKEGWATNEDGQCFPRHERCPKEYHSHEDDESGRCIPNNTPCDPGYVTNPDFPECGLKERICSEHPELKVCGGKGGGDDDNDGNGEDDDDKDVIIKNINNHKVIIQTIKHDRNTFPDIDIIGLSVKGDSGDAMVCLMNIGNEQVQCQEFGVPTDRVGTDFSKVIELDTGKEYDNGNTGSSYVDGTIQSINDQDFVDLENKDNHDFDVDLAAVGINPNSDGMVCIIEESSAPGKVLCEPFKVTEVGAITGQITEITEFS